MKDNRPLYSAARIRETMQKAGLRFQKNFGQNFLIDGNIIRRIAEVSHIEPGDVVLEIGPGLGSLTQELLKRAKKVISIEIDSRLIPVLTEQFSDCPNFLLVEADALKVDYARLLQEEAPGESIKIIANLPYYITTPLIKVFLGGTLPVSRCTLMVQKEVAQRIVARKADADYGAFSIYVDCYADAKLEFTVPKEVFLPQPKVSSAILTLKKKPVIEKGVSVEEVTEVVHRVFQQRRKMLLSTLAKQYGISKEELTAIFERLGISLTARPEELEKKDYFSLVRCLKERA